MPGVAAERSGESRAHSPPGRLGVARDRHCCARQRLQQRREWRRPGYRGWHVTRIVSSCRRLSRRGGGPGHTRRLRAADGQRPAAGLGVAPVGAGTRDDVGLSHGCRWALPENAGFVVQVLVAASPVGAETTYEAA